MFSHINIGVSFTYIPRNRKLILQDFIKFKIPIINHSVVPVDNFNPFETELAHNSVNNGPHTHVSSLDPHSHCVP